MPSRIVVHDELPKSGAGKIDKGVLREALASVARPSSLDAPRGADDD